ncbi:uncharacterized protein LOC135984176 [Chrysemys picta bellii]|uniref:uncharacterized protein LOC135984176 n=1 Tax=Chrysemys picta bellii TaxID=8478 RepID=UPI0032B25623
MPARVALPTLPPLPVPNRGARGCWGTGGSWRVPGEPVPPRPRTCSRSRPVPLAARPSIAPSRKRVCAAGPHSSRSAGNTSGCGRRAVPRETLPPGNTPATPETRETLGQSVPRGPYRPAPLERCSRRCHQRVVRTERPSSRVRQPSVFRFRSAGCDRCSSPSVPRSSGVLAGTPGFCSGREGSGAARAGPRSRGLAPLRLQDTGQAKGALPRPRHRLRSAHWPGAAWRGRRAGARGGTWPLLPGAAWGRWSPEFPSAARRLAENSRHSTRYQLFLHVQREKGHASCTKHVQCESSSQAGFVGWVLAPNATLGPCSPLSPCAIGASPSACDSLWQEDLHR